MWSSTFTEFSSNFRRVWLNGSSSMLVLWRFNFTINNSPQRDDTKVQIYQRLNISQLQHFLFKLQSNDKIISQSQYKRNERIIIVITAWKSPGDSSLTVVFVVHLDRWRSGRRRATLMRRPFSCTSAVDVLRPRCILLIQWIAVARTSWRLGMRADCALTTSNTMHH